MKTELIDGDGFGFGFGDGFGSGDGDGGKLPTTYHITHGEDLRDDVMLAVLRGMMRP